MNAGKGVATAAILIILAIITLYVIVIAQNITFPYWNPPPNLRVIPFGLSYPDIPGMEIPGTYLIVSFLLASNGTIAENVPIQVVNATGQIISSDYANVWNVQVGFQQAIPWDFKKYFEQRGMYIGGLSGVHFSRDVMNPNSSALLPLSENEIYFPVAGDYSPTIRIDLYNGTSILYTYSQMKVHVLSASEVEATNTNRLNLGLAFALLGFSYIQGLVMIRELWTNREKEDQSSANKTIISLTNHEKRPTKKEKKKTSPSKEQKKSGEVLNSTTPNETSSKHKPQEAKDNP
jgi:hypothetical protein